jgi:hypothetical protein
MIRLLLLLEAAAFAAAALVHSGYPITGYEHGKARTAESVIALVLLAAVVAVWIRPRLAGSVGVAAQGFALLGTLIGAFTIAIGVGPRTTPDIGYHAGILILLIWGLILTVRAR